MKKIPNVNSILSGQLIQIFSGEVYMVIGDAAFGLGGSMLVFNEGSHDSNLKHRGRNCASLNVVAVSKPLPITQRSTSHWNLHTLNQFLLWRREDLLKTTIHISRADTGTEIQSADLTKSQATELKGMISNYLVKCISDNA